MQFSLGWNRAGAQTPASISSSRLQDRNFTGTVYNCALYSKGFWTLLRSWTSCTIFARASTTSGWRNEIFKSSITWSSVSSPGQTRKLSSIPARVQRRCTRSLRFSSDIWRSRIFSRCWQERSFCSAFAFCCGGKQDRFWVGSMASRSYFKNKLFYAGWTVLSSLIAWLHTSTMYCGTVS